MLEASWVVYMPLRQGKTANNDWFIDLVALMFQTTLNSIWMKSLPSIIHHNSFNLLLPPQFSSFSDHKCTDPESYKDPKIKKKQHNSQSKRRAWDKHQNIENVCSSSSSNLKITAVLTEQYNQQIEYLQRLQQTKKKPKKTKNGPLHFIICNM